MTMEWVGYQGFYLDTLSISFAFLLSFTVFFVNLFRRKIQLVGNANQLKNFIVDIKKELP